MNVLIPWKPKPGRERVYDYVRSRWEHAGFTIIEGTAPEGEWRKAVAVADAAARASSTIVVVADADVWCDGLSEAVRAVEHGAAWAVPHMRVHRLTEAATDLVLAGGELGGEVEQPPYRGTEGGGLVVAPLATLQDIPPDPRFAGWGGEDHSWSCALTTLAGPRWRGAADLYHLWHPPQQATDRFGRKFGSRDNTILARRYSGAVGDVGRMRALVDQAKEALWQSRSSSTVPASARSFVPQR